MARKKVLVTGIGGNVGQGIIRNIRSIDSEIVVVGSNITDFSAGNHLCDIFYKVPYAYDKGYIEAIITIVNKEKIDLILPATDYEMLYLSEVVDSIPCTVVASDFSTVRTYTDKYESYLHHQKCGLPFAKAFLPSKYTGEFTDFIVKPKEGRGSRGLHINPSDLTIFSDKEYMVQELIKGKEVTTAFYVNKRGQLHGFINMERTLQNGTTQECKVVQEYDDKYTALLQLLVKCADFHGSANLQSIITKDGEIIPFEINCRISGTNSIRSHFGFEDVRYTLEEYLYNKPLSQPAITNGVATRILMDVIYPNQSKPASLKDNNSPHFLF